jgi:hypothetical protein
VAGSRRSRLALAAICAFVVAVGTWNTVHYPPGRGFDALDHMSYADGLVPGGHLPAHGTGEYYTPPGYYAVAGSLDWVARKLGASAYGAHRAGMAVNVLFLLGTVLLACRLARELWPGRERIALGAAAFVALLPVGVRTEAMFHPETMSLFLCTLGLWLCVRTFTDRRFAVALGLALGVAQLVRAFSLWTLAAVALALAVGRRFRELVIVVVLAAAVAAPWYVHQRIEYGGSPVFNRPTVTKPLLERRPLRFYVDPGIPDVVVEPYRPNFVNLALPTTYAELWGDWEGVWTWRWPGPPTGMQRHLLQVQSLAGLLPTLAALAGWLLLAPGSLRSPPRLAAALLPPLGILGYLYFTVSYPTPDGDVLKATYMLTTTTGWALAFGVALDRLRGRAWPVAAALLAVCAVAELPFLVYG